MIQRDANGLVDTQTSYGYWCASSLALEASTGLIRSVPQDSAVVQDPEGEGQIVYLFLPLYKVRVRFIYFLSIA